MKTLKKVVNDKVSDVQHLGKMIQTMSRNEITNNEPFVSVIIKVKVYITKFPSLKRRFQYSKRMCSIEEAKEYINLRQKARINFDNFMGLCKLDRQDYKISIKGQIRS